MSPEEKKEAPKKAGAVIGKAEEVKKAKGGKKPTALKRIVQSKKRQIKNRACKSQISTCVKSIKSTTKEDAVGAQKKLSSLFSLVDKATKKGICKPNKANRIKSKLTLLMKAK
jgi:small subunit ribosomal protein S20